MYKFIQKNQKKFLAIFAVGLMIVFILPTMPFDSGAGGREVAFRLGDETIHSAEAIQAASDLEAAQAAEPRLVFGLLGVMEGRVPPQLAITLNENKEMFLLLQKEAEQLGLRAPEDEVGANAVALAQEGVDRQAAQRTVRGLLLIRALFDRVTSGIKPSEAAVTRELARELQRVKLNLVHYAIDDFANDVPAPTDGQLRAHFEAFKDKLPGGTTEQNPFGFGYMAPNRVTLSYLTVPRDQVAAVVKKRKSDFDWRVEALLHYRANPGDYPVTQPADTQPSTGPATAPAQSGPTTRPFEEVETEIVNELIRPEVDRRAAEIASEIAERMKSDFQAVQKKSAAAAAEFATSAYLQRVKEDVQKKHGVQLGVSEIDEPKSEEELRELPGIGRSFLDRGESFAQHVMRWTEPLASPADRAADDALSLNEPSHPLRDFDGNLYVFQVRQATPARAPADMEAVKEKVEADLRRKLAFEAASEAARKLHAAAATDGLAAAAKAAGKDVFTSPAFPNPASQFADPTPVDLLPGVDLPRMAYNQLVKQGFGLLERATPDKPHPREVISLPAAGRVVAAELGEVERLWDDAFAEIARQQFGQSIAARRAAPLLEEYFRPEAVKQRLAYRNPNDAPPKPTTAPAGGRS